MNVIAKKERFLILVILLTFIMPATTYGYVALIAMVIISLILFPRNITRYGSISIFVFLVSFIANSVTKNIYAKDLVIAVVIFLFVFSNGKNKIKYSSSYKRIPVKIFLFIFGFVLFSQMTMLVHIQPFDSFFRSNYTALDLYNYEGSISSMLASSYYRAAGMFGNPNQCAKFCSLIFCFFLYSQNKNERLNLIVVATYLFVLTLAGSRTGFFVTIMAGIAYYVTNKGIKVKTISKLIVFIGIAIIVIYPLVSYLRFFNLNEGIEYSLNLKFGVISDYIHYSANDIFMVMFGNFYTSSSFDLLNNTSIFSFGLLDSDLGYIYYSYGIFGSFAIVGSLITKFKSQQIAPILFCIFLWCISSSVLFHFKFIVLFYFIVLYYNNYAHTAK